MRVYRTFFLSAFLSLFLLGCANITTPTGGKKDMRPPKLVEISPADSQLNTMVSRLEMRFDEYITVSDVGNEVSISPTLRIDPIVTGLLKKVTVKIADTLLEPYTTYRISFGNAIKDLHEGNPFKSYTYTFSTGPYFDTLSLRGKIINAGTGLTETDAVLVGLYDTDESDSAVVRHKPKYVIKSEGGKFAFKGLPERKFWIYAMKDANNNMTYDGPVKGEMIAFNDSSVIPGIDSLVKPIRLRLFAEVPDTSIKADQGLGKKKMGVASTKSKERKLVYTLNVDTSDVTKKTFDLTKDIEISFSDSFYLNKGKIALTYDSAGIAVTPLYTIKQDSTHLRITSAWAADKVYTLKLAKGFARDTADEEFAPSKHIFRTWDEDNYGKLIMHLPSRYGKDSLYIFRAITGTDTVYQKVVTDTVFKIVRLKPGQYSLAVIVDKNKNGKWDTGDLFNKIQPEEVIPYEEALTLKAAGWDTVIDFEQKDDKRNTLKKAKDKGK